MPVRLSARLAVREDEMIQKAKAKSITDSDISSQSNNLSNTTAGEVKAFCIDSGFIPGTRNEASSRKDPVQEAEGIGSSSGDPLIQVAASLSTPDLATEDPGLSPTSQTATSYSTAHSTASTIAEKRPPASPLDSSATLSSLPGEANTVGTKLRESDIPVRTEEVKPDHIGSRRVNPPRSAAAKVIDRYRFGGSQIIGEHKESGPSTMTKSGSRPSGQRESVEKIYKVRQSRGDERSSDEFKSQTTTSRASKRKRPSSSTIAKASGKTDKPVETTHSEPEIDVSTTQVVGKDGKDEDFRPSAGIGNAETLHRQYKFRNRKPRARSIQQIEHETRMTTMAKIARPERTRRIGLRKGSRGRRLRDSAHLPDSLGKRTIKDEDGNSLFEESTAERVVKKRPVRFSREFTNRYKIDLSWTPFRHNTRPYGKHPQKVFEILRTHHEDEVTLEKYTEDKTRPPPGNSQGPMHAGQNVTFDAIVRTILSQATNNGNAQTAEQSLIHHFRHDFLGVKAKGRSPNYHAIRKAPDLVLANALASGGLQHMKAKSIKGCLDVVYAENMARASGEERLKAETVEESADFEPGMLSLDYMFPMSLQEKFDHLVGMPGIGVKTAACILAFNFEYPLFAVDTHVMRLSRMLKWLPLNASSEDHAFMHLNYRVPNELKYGLHQAFWHHGQHCVRCQAGTNQNSKGWKDTQCPIEGLVDRSRKDIPRPKRKAKLVKEGDELEEPNQDKEDMPQPKKIKKQPHVLPYTKLTPDRAQELGYELRTIMIDDAFGVRRANRTAKPLVRWVLSSDHGAIEKTDRKTTVEDLAARAEPPNDDVGDTVLNADNDPNDTSFTTYDGDRGATLDATGESKVEWVQDQAKDGDENVPQDEGH